MSFYAVDMPLPVVPNVARARVSGTVAGFPWNNIWYFGLTTTTAPTAGDMNALAHNLHNAYKTVWPGEWDPNVTLEDVETIDLTTTSSATGGWTEHVVGTAAGTVSDSESCVLTKLIIPRRYRGGHPRKYLPPMQTNLQLSDREWIHAIIDARATAFGTALQNISTAPPFPYPTMTVSGIVNVSFYSGFTNYVKPSGRAASRPTPRGSAIVDFASGIELEYTIATQRRRIGR